METSRLVLEKIIDQCCEDNILVYDNNDKKGIFTRRLSELMIENCKKKIICILVNSIDNHENCDILLVPTRIMNGIEEYFKKCGNMLVYGDNNLAIAICEDRTGLLGSY